MNRVFLILSVVIALFSGCEEVPPYIDFTAEEVLDTGYMVDSVTAPQHKIVFVEDITGVRCVNCPTAAKKIRDIITAKSEDSIVAMALYPWPTNSNPLSNNTIPFENFPQLANDISSQLVESLGIPQGLPSGYVDRYKFSASEKPQAVSSWSTLVDQRLKNSTPVNITMKKDVSGRKISVDINLLYTQHVTGSHKYAVYLTEDHIISKQKSTTGDIDNYEHNHALRYAFDLTAGRGLTGKLLKGKAYNKHYSYVVPADSEIKIENCHIICVIIDAATNEVVNVRKIALQ